LVVNAIARQGVAAALADQVTAERDAAGEQLDLIGVPSHFDREGAEKGGDARLIAASARRRGRPAGAQNLATRDMLDFCRRVFGDPVMRGFQWLEHTPETLASVLGCTRLEAFDRLEAIRKSLQPLFYANQAPVDAEGKAVPFFALTVGGASSSAPGAKPPWLYDGGPTIENEQNQALSSPDPAQSHDAKSHGDDK
jgi:nitroreductase